MTRAQFVEEMHALAMQIALTAQSMADLKKALEAHEKQITSLARSATRFETLYSLILGTSGLFSLVALLLSIFK
jgi:hypothetical protein